MLFAQGNSLSISVRMTTDHPGKNVGEMTNEVPKEFSRSA